MERELEGILTQQKTVLGNRNAKQVGTNRKGRALVGSEGHTAEHYFKEADL